MFDGHGGKEVAKFCRDHFTAEFVKSPQFNSGNYVGALRETFHTMDAMVDDEVKCDIDMMSFLSCNSYQSSVIFVL